MWQEVVTVSECGILRSFFAAKLVLIEKLISAKFSR